MNKFSDLITYRITAKETDLLVSTEKELKEIATSLLLKHKYEVEYFIATNSVFKVNSYKIKENTSLIVKEIMETTKTIKIEPKFVAEAAIAEYVGKDLCQQSREVIIENRGNIFLKSDKTRKINIFSSHYHKIFSSKKTIIKHKLAIEIVPENTFVGICISSNINEVYKIIISDSVILSSACISAIEKLDMNEGINFGSNIKGIKGILIIDGNHFGIWGKIKLVK